MRFGMDTRTHELGPREMNIIKVALSNHRRYFVNLARRNREPEVTGRNTIYALEIQILLEKLDAIGQAASQASMNR